MRKRLKTTGKCRPLCIKNPVAHRLAELVSKRLGGTLSDAVISALEDELRETPSPWTVR